MSACAFPGCKREATKSLCPPHLLQRSRNGAGGLRPLRERNPDYGERFWEKVSRGDGCWEWTASLTAFGYGQVMTIDRARGMRRPCLAHRVAWELHHGEAIPCGMYVCHHCDNPKCVRPDHLFLGTALDNTRDMWAKGRQVISVRARGKHGALTRSEQGRWRAWILVDNRRRFVGQFGTKEEAIARAASAADNNVRSNRLGRF